jgi:hypothetical protein
MKYISQKLYHWTHIQNKSPMIIISMKYNLHFIDQINHQFVLKLRGSLLNLIRGNSSDVDNSMA